MNIEIDEVESNMIRVGLTDLAVNRYFQGDNIELIVRKVLIIDEIIKKLDKAQEDRIPC